MAWLLTQRNPLLSPQNPPCAHTLCVKLPPLSHFYNCCVASHRFQHSLQSHVSKDSVHIMSLYCQPDAACRSVARLVSSPSHGRPCPYVQGGRAEDRWYQGQERRLMVLAW